VGSDRRLNIRLSSKDLEAIQKRALAEGLPYQAITGEQLAKEQANDVKGNLSFFNTLLLIFAIISLFVGAFIIYNTFSITVAQRLRELGLLRSLGATGRQVVGSVAFEALAVGLFSSGSAWRSASRS
jgi:putative ABC transport system permease protein